jgi:hypothetical protein
MKISKKKLGKYTAAKAGVLLTFCVPVLLTLPFATLVREQTRRGSSFEPLLLFWAT